MIAPRLEDCVNDLCPLTRRPVSPRPSPSTRARWSALPIVRLATPFLAAVLAFETAIQPRRWSLLGAAEEAGEGARRPPDLPFVASASPPGAPRWSGRRLPLRTHPSRPPAGSTGGVARRRLFFCQYRTCYRSPMAHSDFRTPRVFVADADRRHARRLRPRPEQLSPQRAAPSAGDEVLVFDGRMASGAASSSKPARRRRNSSISGRAGRNRPPQTSLSLRAAETCPARLHGPEGGGEGVGRMKPVLTQHTQASA